MRSRCDGLDNWHALPWAAERVSKFALAQPSTGPLPAATTTAVGGGGGGGRGRPPAGAGAIIIIMLVY